MRDEITDEHYYTLWDYARISILILILIIFVYYIATKYFGAGI